MQAYILEKYVHREQLNVATKNFAHPMFNQTLWRAASMLQASNPSNQRATCESHQPRRERASKKMSSFRALSHIHHIQIPLSPHPHRLRVWCSASPARHPHTGTSDHLLDTIIAYSKSCLSFGANPFRILSGSATVHLFLRATCFTGKSKERSGGVLAGLPYTHL